MFILSCHKLILLQKGVGIMKWRELKCLNYRTNFRVAKLAFISFSNRKGANFKKQGRRERRECYQVSSKIS
ncbi:MAG: hypothetical protein AUJ47_12080 [Candidatus Marinimicrobia bacterium CG1_02_48_14]|nr:MAG: hypothetical protein AUJ47_12080 [Candidatus Marinimicrobia bacterium CG1_02_48_14]